LANHNNGEVTGIAYYSDLSGLSEVRGIIEKSGQFKLTFSATVYNEAAMANTMKAAVVHDFGQPLEIQEVPIPTPGPGQVLIKLVANGVCHTDLHAAQGDWPAKPKPPFIPGHEGAGVVAALGPGVKHLKEGDPVGLAWLHDSCGECEYCRAGWDALCLTQHNSGYSINGSLAEYALGSAAYVGQLPPKPDFVTRAPILCAGVTTYKGIKESEV
jgi:alcohol dehydrogenase, propanol-preferring